MLESSFVDGGWLGFGRAEVTTATLPEPTFETRSQNNQMDRLGVQRESACGLLVVAELGEGHPQTGMMDVIQAATGQGRER